MRKFKLNKDGNFVEIKIKKRHKPILNEEAYLPVKESAWSKIAKFFYSCFMRLKKQIDFSMNTEENSKFYTFENYIEEEKMYKDFFGM